MNAYNYLIDMGNPSSVMNEVLVAKRIGDMLKTKESATPQYNGLESTAQQPQKRFGTMSPIFDKETLSVNYGDMTKKGGHRNWRNNNPGNIEYGDYAKRMGAIGSDGRFAIFPDMDTGYMAQKSLLKTKSYRDLNLGDAIGRYAPSSENDTGAYVGMLTKYTGITPDTPLNSLDDTQLDRLVRAMSMVEGMKEGEIIRGGA